MAGCDIRRKMTGETAKYSSPTLQRNKHTPFMPQEAVQAAPCMRAYARLIAQRKVVNSKCRQAACCVHRIFAGNEDQYMYTPVHTQ